MCGIAGLIGESKVPQASYDLITEITRNLERRGEDSTGFWGAQKGSKGAITYHKEPSKSSLFVNKPVWKANQKFNANLMIIHARAASSGVGGPSVNMNNHPFVSEDRTLGVVHNGKLPEYKFLQTKYDTLTNCDSELALRILTCQNELPLGLQKNENITELQKHRLSGIRKLWSLSCYAQMAIAVGEWFDDGTRHLWLFRNSHRPLWIADMRSTLGQLIFFSEPSIWYDSIKAVPYLESYITDKNRMFELPTEEVWFFEVNSENSMVRNNLFQKFEIVKVKTHACEDKDVKSGIPFEVKKEKPHRIICSLNEKDEVPTTTTFTSVTKTKVGTNTRTNTSSSAKKSSHPTCEGYYSHVKTQEDKKKEGKIVESTETKEEEEEETETNVELYDRNDSMYGMHILQETYDYQDSCGHATVSTLCDDIKNITSEIEVNFTNQSLEGSVADNEYRNLLDSLETIKADLTTTQHLLDSNRS